MLNLGKSGGYLPGVEMTNDLQNRQDFFSGYVLLTGRTADTLRRLAALLWERGVPAYAANGARALDKAVAVHGVPSQILLQTDAIDTELIIELEAFRLRHEVPLVCVAGDMTRPQVQALLHMTTDFVLAPYTPDELLLRILRVGRHAARTRGIASTLDAPYTRDRRPETPKHFVLTAQEIAILERLQADIGRPVATEELCAHIPGRSLEQRVRLLRVHIFRLRRKIEPNPRNPIYIQTVREIGYSLSEPITVPYASLDDADVTAAD